MRTRPLLLLAPFALALLAACGDDRPSGSGGPFPTTGSTPEAPGNPEVEEAMRRLKEHGTDVTAMRETGEEVAARLRAPLTKPLTDADVDRFVALYPDYRAAKADPVALRAALAKHGADTVDWALLAARITGLASLLQAPNASIPDAMKGDAEVVRRRLPDIRKALEAK
jgi:hypothetical protein